MYEKYRLSIKVQAVFIFIFMWIAMDAFFIYLLTLKDMSSTYWFVAIPIVFFNVLGGLSLWVNMAKGQNEIADICYICTNKAIYLVNEYGYKNVSKIDFTEITKVEKSIKGEGFVVCSEFKSINVAYIHNIMEWYKEIEKRTTKKVA